MKNKISSGLIIVTSLISILGSHVLLANAASGSQYSNSSSIITTTPSYTYTPPVDPNAPWIGNLTVSSPTYDVGSVDAVHLGYDYKNIPQADTLPQIIIYKDGDASKTDLKKNYLSYNISKAMVTGVSNGPQSGTGDYSWYAEASTTQYVDPGTYVFQVSWSDNTTQLPTQTIKFNVTNTGKIVPFDLSNLSATPNPFNPNTGDQVNFNFTVNGLHSGETINLLNYAIADSGINKVFSNSLSSSFNNGDNSINWNGQNSMAKTVPDGTYAVYLIAVTSQNRLVKMTPFSMTLDSSVTNPQPTPTPTPVTPVVPSTPTTTTTVTTTTTSSDTTCDAFTDIKSTDANCAIYTWAKTAGIFTGNADGTFDPNGSLQRDQVIKTVLEAFKKYHAGTEYCPTGESFPDVANNSWAREYICLGKKTYIRGAYLITGYQSGPYKGLFLPANNVTRSEFLAMILRNLSTDMPNVTVKPYSDVELNQWDTGFAAYAALHLSAIYPQPNLFRAQAVTRMEAAQVFYALHNLGAF